MRLRPVAASIVVALCAFAARSAWKRDRVALLVDNRSANPAAAGEVSPAVRETLGAKGYEVIGEAEVASLVQSMRLESTADLDPAAAAKLCQAARADAVLVVTVSFFLDARAREHGPRASPAFGLQARMISATGKVWRNSIGWIADELPPTALFRKAPPRPTAQACERLLWSMPRGRPDPEAPAQVAVVEETAKAPPASRFQAAVPRQRNFTGVAHFPLRMDRSR